MAEWFDKDLPESIRMGQRLTTMTSGQKRFPDRPVEVQVPAARPVRRVGQRAAAAHGEDGRRPGDRQDGLDRGDQPRPGDHLHLHRATSFPAGASLGSWLSYGLGSENEDLPAFVVMTATWSGRSDAQAIYNRLWGGGFLPSKHQGVALRSQGDPVLYLSNPDGRRRRDPPPDARRARPSSTSEHLDEIGDPETQRPHRPVRDGLPDADARSPS